MKVLSVRLSVCLSYASSSKTVRLELWSLLSTNRKPHVGSRTQRLAWSTGVFKMFLRPSSFHWKLGEIGPWLLVNVNEYLIGSHNLPPVMCRGRQRHRYEPNWTSAWCIVMLPLPCLYWVYIRGGCVCVWVGLLWRLSVCVCVCVVCQSRSARLCWVCQPSKPSSSQVCQEGFWVHSDGRWSVSQSVSYAVQLSLSLSLSLSFLCRCC